MNGILRAIGSKVLGESSQGELRQLLKLMSAFFGSNMVFLFTQAISGLLVARWAGPEYMGYLNTVAVFLSYAPILLLGLNNGLNRELPYLVGQGNVDEVQVLANTAWWWVRFSGVATGAIFAFIGASYWMSGNVYLGQAWLVNALVAPIMFLTQTIEVTFSTSNDFLKLSKVKIINGVLAICTAPIVLFSSWWGLLGRTALLSSAYYAFLHRGRRIIPVAAFSMKAFKRLAKVGLPIFAVGYIFSIFSVLDRTMIINFLGTKQMGLYTPAIQIGAAFSVLPASINQIIYPRMCTIYGRTGSARSLARLAFSPVIVLSVSLLPVYILAWWLVKPFIEVVLPKYVEGIPSARWMIVTMYFWCLGTPQDVFTTINKLWPYVCAIVVAGLANIGVTMWLLREDWGLSAIGAGRAVGMMILVLVSILVAAYYVFRYENPEGMRR